MSRLDALRRDVRSESGRNALWGLGAEIGQIAVSVGVFLGLALVLETRDYGLYAAVVAMSMIMANLAHMGGHVLMVRRVSRGADLEPEWQRTITTVVGGTLIGTLVLVAMRPLFVDEVSVRTFVLLVVSQTTFFWLAEAATQSSQALRRLEVGAKAKLSFASVRLLSLGGFALFGTGDLDGWAWWALGGAAIGGLLSVAIAQRSFGVRAGFRPPSRTDLREGAPFVLSATSDGVLDSIDRPLLTRYGFATENGFYSIAYRIATISMLPVMAMARATDANFFERGSRNPAEALDLAKRLTIRSAGYGIVVGIGLVVCAPILPWMFGDKFDDVATVLPWIAVLPVLRGFQMFPANALTGADRHNQRLALMIAAMLLNLGLNLYFIPRYSWKGATATTLIAEAFFAVGLWVVASRLRHAKPRPGADTTSPASPAEQHR